MIRILTVCTGNICRSPYAERFLQQELDRVSSGSFVVRSAGTHAMAGHGMDERAALKLSETGATDQAFMARQLSAELIMDVDLVLALTEEHRNEVVKLSPRLLKRTYTIREFAAVLEEIKANASLAFPTGGETHEVDERWAALLKAAQLARYAARLRVQDHMDVVDPYRQSDEVYGRMVDELLPALATVVDFELLHALE